MSQQCDFDAVIKIKCSVFHILYFPPNVILMLFADSLGLYDNVAANVKTGKVS